MYMFGNATLLMVHLYIFRSQCFPLNIKRRHFTDSPRKKTGKPTTPFAHAIVEKAMLSNQLLATPNVEDRDVKLVNKERGPMTSLFGRIEL